VSGFGRTDTGSGLSDELRYVDVPVTSVDNTDKLIYAGGNNYDSCQGDSGGPMFADNTLTGIVSYGATCGGGGAYTMVSQFLSFIIEKIHKYGTPNEVCGNTTFENLGIMPDDVSFQWTASPSYLFTNSSGTGLSFTTAQNGTNNGVGTITLTATHTSGQIVSVSKQVWVGQPASINIVTDGTFSIYGNNATLCKIVGYCMTSNSTVTLNGSDFNTATSFSYNGWPSYNSFFNTYTQQVSNDRACFGTNNTGTYYLSIYASNTCGSNSRSVIFQVNNCGYRIYPNPAKTTISIEFDEPDKPESIPDLIEIKSEKTLQTVSKKELQGNEKRNPKAVEKISFDVADLPRGVYYVHLTFGSSKEQKVDKVRIILNE
jgi:hypothetical protein